jgi:hypothetical protein
MQACVANLESLLSSSTIVKQKAFLRTFVKNVVVDSREVAINYTLPIDSADKGQEMAGILPFVIHSKPPRNRTFTLLPVSANAKN